MNIPIDKQAHALGGAVIVLLSIVAGWPLWLGLLICPGVALAKEVYDRVHPHAHTADVWDFLATCLGGLVSALFVLSLKLFIQST
jgi:hypothetical protein